MNKKGFAISGMIYAILILFLALIAGILGLLGNRKLLLDKNKNDVINKLNNIEFTSELYKDNSGASMPNLDDGLIAVKITDNGKIEKADLKKKWYDYNLKQWANAVLVSDESRENYKNAGPGTRINAKDIKAFYVWVPRYRYEIFTDVNNLETVGNISNASSYINKAQKINIVFEDKDTAKSTGTAKGEWLTHPAFTFGSDELNGIWVGKYETTGTKDIPTVLAFDNRYEETKSIKSLRSQKISAQFTTSQKINYGLTNLEASMLKNMEWGAVAYLTNSEYGRCTKNEDETYTCEEVMINNSSYYNTGCAATVAPTKTTGGYKSQTNHSEGYYAGCENQWYTVAGQKASTTGNMYGIYDMSGGALEHVMGVMEGTTGTGEPSSGKNKTYNSGFNGKFTCPTCDGQTAKNLTTGIDFPASQYYNVYSRSSTYINDYAGRGHLGDATYELDGFTNWTDPDGNKRYHSGWNKDLGYFVGGSYPWFMRGGGYNDGASAGMFSFTGSYGSSYDTRSFRSVLR